MKYLKWILKKGSRKTVVVWVISTVFGSAAFLAIAILWLIHTWNYASHGNLPTTNDIIIVGILALYVVAPAWIGYYFSDRKLFYDEFIKDPNNY